MTTTNHQYAFMRHLNPAQSAAAVSVDGPVMIVAGAGSGKTRVLTYRIAYLIQSGVPPESILALTFTNKAAGEMKSRIRRLLDEGGQGVWAGTFHSVFARILRNEAETLGYGRNFTIYDTEESLAVIRSVMGSLNIPQQEFHPRSIRSRISAAKNQLLSSKELAESATDFSDEKTAVVYREYEKILKKNNALDFDDLLLKPLILFDKFPRRLERYQYRFRYILVDEYQDTNRVQYFLLRHLAARHSNICVVGDDAQSIYAFRGADIRNMLDFERDYPACRTFRLEQNYRSTGSILSAANSVILRNREQIPKKLWTENPPGELPVVHRCMDERDEGLRVLSIIEEESRKHKRDLKDFVVLYRTNSQSRVIEDALRRNGIPYSIVGSVAFYRRKEIKDILAYLTLIANPADNRSFERVVNFPPRGIGDVTLKKLSAFADAKGVSLTEAARMFDLGSALPERIRRKLSDFVGMIGKYAGLKNQMSISELARTIVDATGILRLLKDENTPEALVRKENIEELISALSEFNDQYPEAKLEDFLEEVSLVSDVDTADFGRNAVTLMTLHSAKGLEFPVVCIVGLEEGIFPLSGAAESPGELEEERRLLYVGMTRARERLYLIYAVSRYRHGQLSYMVRSRFLDEIDEVLLSTVEAGSPRSRTAGSTGPRFPGRSLRKRSQIAAKSASFDDPFPAYEEETQEHQEIRVGLRVAHRTFGAGRILALDGTGERMRAIVDFESVGRKQLLLKYAHLRPVGR